MEACRSDEAKQVGRCPGGVGARDASPGLVDAKEPSAVIHQGRRVAGIAADQLRGLILPEAKPAAVEAPVDASVPPALNERPPPALDSCGRLVGVTVCIDREDVYVGERPGVTPADAASDDQADDSGHGSKELDRLLHLAVEELTPLDVDRSLHSHLRPFGIAVSAARSIRQRLAAQRAHGGELLDLSAPPLESTGQYHISQGVGSKRRADRSVASTEPAFLQASPYEVAIPVPQAIVCHTVDPALDGLDFAHLTLDVSRHLADQGAGVLPELLHHVSVLLVATPRVARAQLQKGPLSHHLVV